MHYIDHLSMVACVLAGLFVLYVLVKFNEPRWLFVFRRKIRRRRLKRLALGLDPPVRTQFLHALIIFCAVGSFAYVLWCLSAKGNLIPCW